jgi:hypothetical protein
MPTRDDLVAAWGDHVLSNLRARARAAFALGRFVAVEDGVAVFALPNSAHVEHATPLLSEVAEAISRQVGGTVGLRLVTENDIEPSVGGGPGAGPADAPSTSRPVTAAGDREPSSDSSTGRRGKAMAATAATELLQPAEAGSEDDEPDVDDLAPGKVAGHHDSASWAEGRLLEAFPGAEEVS